MWLKGIFIILVSCGAFHLIRHRINLKKAADKTGTAIYPASRQEMNSILIPINYKEMEPLSKRTKSYQLVKWGSRAIIAAVVCLTWFVLTTEEILQILPTVLYLFILSISTIKHRGNFYILPDGLIVNGKFIPWTRIKEYKVEKIMKYHPLYGLDDKINHAYKLSIKVKNIWLQTNYVVVRDPDSLDRILALLEERGITGSQLKDSGYMSLRKN
ncbi:hypothetical protein [Bacillus sp. KH172YL63]|uniref:hypothetical protein n=1 Tax=Bacillus sp. KH172YL63 TaxID=2709784 RepID=UPI0013E46040|nr:hypothetical protein [Bacillus sp. KH172YL63]BCB03726.1 hypothetical protein KH172YL63_18590 [Bacillus sp. KH172YL63]